MRSPRPPPQLEALALRLGEAARIVKLEDVVTASRRRRRKQLLRRRKKLLRRRPDRLLMAAGPRPSRGRGDTKSSSVASRESRETARVTCKQSIAAIVAHEAETNQSSVPVTWANTDQLQRIWAVQASMSGPPQSQCRASEPQCSHALHSTPVHLSKVLRRAVMRSRKLSQGKGVASRGSCAHGS